MTNFQDRKSNFYDDTFDGGTMFVSSENVELKSNDDKEESSNEDDEA